VQVRWDDASFTILANTTVGSNGSFSVSFTVPANATVGAHTIAFVDLDFETGYVHEKMPDALTECPRGGWLCRASLADRTPGYNSGVSVSYGQMWVAVQTQKGEI
jgi:hypothetical protein